MKLVHKLHWCLVQWEVSSPKECTHKQEVFQSGLSSPSYDGDHDIESVEHQVYSSEAIIIHTTCTTLVVATASAVLKAVLELFLPTSLIDVLQEMKVL